jgi:hypothetical protein
MCDAPLHVAFLRIIVSLDRPLVGLTYGVHRAAAFRKFFIKTTTAALVERRLGVFPRRRGRSFREALTISVQVIPRNSTGTFKVGAKLALPKTFWKIAAKNREFLDFFNPSAMMAQI